jgi:hypothetical protein
MFAISPLMSALSTPTHDSRAKEIEEKEKRELTQMTKSQIKAKIGSFE